MARPIVLSNGELHVGLNSFGLVHDFYYPYVGLENHASGKSLRHRVGVWVEGQISWLDGDGWSFSFAYPHDALIGHTVARNESMGVILEFDDYVDAEMSAFVRNVHVINTFDRPREIRVFMHQAFAIGDSRSNTDTAQYLPDIHGILHYRGQRAFVIGAKSSDEWFDQHAVGLFEIEGHEGTYRDADDGELSMSNVEHGRVDSTLRLPFQLGAHESGRAQYWIACGTSLREALYIHKTFSKLSSGERLRQNAKWWYRWLEPTFNAARTLPEEYKRPFIESAMIIKSQIDNRGAVIASTDTAMLNYSRDTYAYCWPRDGANVIWPLIRLGYRDEPHQFFSFCRRGLHPRGFLMHKYRADGALGSSWHPYLHDDGMIAPPIQEDETALVLFVFSQFYARQQDPQLLKEFYEPLVVPMADFLASYIDESTGLPKPTYDLWEEHFGTFTYTTAVTFAALMASSHLADLQSDETNAVKWRTAAETIQEAAQKSLYDSSRGAFYKSVSVDRETKQLTHDETIDVSSFYGAFMFGLFPLDGEEIKAAAETVAKTFGFGDGQFGLPRYENDYYRRTNPDRAGNWWPLISLWMAQYMMECGDPGQSREIIDWVLERRLQSGVMSEQIDPDTNQIISVAPLTWSHAELLSSLIDFSSEEG